VRAAVLVLACAVAGAGSGESPYAELGMESQGPVYTVRYSFRTDCPVDSLLEAFLQPRHVEACMRRGNLRIHVLDTARLRNRIEYTYNYMISRLRITFNRMADTSLNRVSCVLESCTTSGSSIVPSVRSSRGYYALVDEGDSMRVDYWQQTTLDRDLTDLYLYFIRRDTRKVLHTQQRYVTERRRWADSGNH